MSGMTRGDCDDEGLMRMKMFTDPLHKLCKSTSVVPRGSRLRNKLVLLSFSSDFFFLFSRSFLASLSL